jgi:cysteine desulfurase
VSVYLDWNATAPPLDAVIEAVARASREHWGNPQSVHSHGRSARAVVEDARAAVAELAHADPRDVVFTSGGTEANNLAIRSFHAEKGGVLLTSTLEHPSVARLSEVMETRWLSLLPDGRVDLYQMEQELAHAGDVGVVALQAVNQETGVIQPLREAIEIAHKYGARIHVDAIQGWGKAEETGEGADSRSLAAHKIRGPKGIGALVLGCGTKLSPLLLGGGQERGMRPGTMDAALSAGLAVCARHAKDGPARYATIAPLRDELEAQLESLGGTSNGKGVPRAPHVISMAFEGWDGAELVAALDLEGVSVSSGSACAAGTMEPSSVVTRLFGEARARSSVRISMGETTSREDVLRAKEAFARVLSRR